MEGWRLNILWKRSLRTGKSGSMWDCFSLSLQTVTNSLFDSGAKRRGAELSSSMDSIQQIYILRNVHISLVYIIYKQYTVSVTVMDMMEESETSNSKVFSVCLQLVWFTRTRSVGSTEVQWLRNYETVTFSLSGIVHNLGNPTTLSGCISVHSGNMWGPEL